MKYSTWYEFRRDCQARLGRPLSNRTWLMLKPRRPLPWDEHDARALISTATRQAIFTRLGRLDAVSSR